MAILQLKRTNEFINRLRDYQIYIDGQHVGTIANGEIKDFQTTEGQHTVLAKIDWASSPEFIIHLEDTQTKHMIVSGFKNSNYIMPFGLALLAIEFLLSTLLEMEWTILLPLPLFILIIYYITVGRKKYLTLKEISAEANL